jgi:hypothetical protein
MKFSSGLEIGELIANGGFGAVYQHAEARSALDRIPMPAWFVPGSRDTDSGSHPKYPASRRRFGIGLQSKPGPAWK